MPRSGPPDPLAGMGMAFVQLHEMFVQMVRAGYTEIQALRLQGEMLAAAQARSEDKPKENGAQQG
jgi:hypothetical protein